MVSILVFGDSITYGMWDEKGGWVQRLRMYFDKSYLQEFLIYNLGVPGDDTRSLLKRFEFEASQRIDDRNDVVIFAMGINDSMCVFERNMVPINVFESNLKQLIYLAEEFVDNVIFLGLTPVTEKLTYSFVENQGYLNRFIKEYNQTIAKICSEEKVVFVDLWTLFNSENFSKLLSDGLHPNSQGHLIICKEVKKVLKLLF